MKQHKLSLAILFLTFAGMGCSAQSQTNSTQSSKGNFNRENLRDAIPLGLDNVHIGMPSVAFLKVRENVKTARWFDEDIPINPKSKNMWVNESVMLNPQDVYNRRSIDYTIRNGFLKSVNIVEYFDEKELESRTNFFLVEAIERYGPPAFLKVRQEVGKKRPSLFWYKNDTLVEASYTPEPYMFKPKMLGNVLLYVQAGSKAELMEKKQFASLSQAEAEKFLLPAQDAIRKALQEAGEKPVGQIPVEIGTT